MDRASGRQAAMRRHRCPQRGVRQPVDRASLASDRRHQEHRLAVTTKKRTDDMNRGSETEDPVTALAARVQKLEAALAAPGRGSADGAVGGGRPGQRTDRRTGGVFRDDGAQDGPPGPSVGRGTAVVMFTNPGIDTYDLRSGRVSKCG